MDLAEAGRKVVQGVLTAGAAVFFLGSVLIVCADVWKGDDQIEVGTVFAAVIVSLSVTFASAFVGWFGITASVANITLQGAGARRAWSLLKQLFSTLPGAAVLAMIIYLVAGAIAGITYLSHEKESPTMLITVATAWAAQTSAVMAATLASALKTP